MANQPELLYADSSVFGGCFDDEFELGSNLLMNAFRTGQYRLATSELVEDELVCAPPYVMDLFDSLLVDAKVITVDDAAEQLQRAYVDRQIVGPRQSADAMHVALATIANCRAIVSWNFKHIVQMSRISLYNEVNVKLGYNVLAIHSPWEVVGNGR